MKNPLRAKQLQKGLLQLSEEGAVQVFRPVLNSSDYVLGAVGALQFDVTMARLRDEYGVDAVYDPVDYATARWLVCDDKTVLDEFERSTAPEWPSTRKGISRISPLTSGAWANSSTTGP